MWADETKKAKETMVSPKKKKIYIYSFRQDTGHKIKQIFVVFCGSSKTVTTTIGGNNNNNISRIATKKVSAVWSLSKQHDNLIIQEIDAVIGALITITICNLW